MVVVARRYLEPSFKTCMFSPVEVPKFFTLHVGAMLFCLESFRNLQREITCNCFTQHPPSWKLLEVWLADLKVAPQPTTLILILEITELAAMVSPKTTPYTSLYYIVISCYILLYHLLRSTVVCSMSSAAS